ncbi:restriction endonuclease subunit S, partial [Serratia sp. IR-2025]
DLTDVTRVNATQHEVVQYSLRENDFLFNTRNSKELVGKTCVFNSTSKETVLYNNNMLRAVFLEGVLSYQIDIWMRSSSGKTELEKIKSGTTNVWAIYQGKLELLCCLVPPLAEQYRIVAKVDELMHLCDQLEQQSLSSLDAHQQLIETLLATLTDSQNAEEFAESWARISQHFDTLFITEASIDALKQTILQLAVMGKLVPQDPNDEPASELLKRIEQEKAQLVKEGKIKKQKPLPPVSDEEKPFELPKGWAWCRLGHCIHLISGQHLKPNEYSESIVEGAIPYITGPAEFGDSNPTYSKFTLEKRAVAKPKDILITCKGAGLGKLNVANVEIAISRQLMSIRAISTSFDYFKLLLSSMYNYFQGKGIGIAIPGISREDVTEPVILLPPLNEQERIVLNVNSLFGLCDTLKSRLQSAQQTQLHLADALTDAALN